MFEKTTEIINNSKPDRFLYWLWGIDKNNAGFYQEDCCYRDPFTFNDFFETAKEAAEALFHEPMCDENYAESKSGLRCERYALHKMTNEILEEFKKSIIETEYLYTQKMYDKSLKLASERNWYPACPHDGEKAFPYRNLTKKFVKSWTYDNLRKYFDYNNKLCGGVSDLCDTAEYKNFIFVYDWTDGNYYFGSSDCEQLEDYTPAEDIDEEDEENEEEYED